jgi:hypothetical protein
MNQHPHFFVGSLLWNYVNNERVLVITNSLLHVLAKSIPVTSAP